MKDWKSKPNLKRNALIAAVMLFVGAAAYLNWSYNQRWGSPDRAMAEAEDQMTSAVEAIFGTDANTGSEARPTSSISGYFAQARLTRQQSRDQALSLLESAACAESASQETIDAAVNSISEMANWSMLENRIENELLAKSFSECVVYLSSDGCTVSVPAPEEGLSDAEVARITDAVTNVTELSAAQINIIEVMH